MHYVILAFTVQCDGQNLRPILSTTPVSRDVLRGRAVHTRTGVKSYGEQGQKVRPNTLLNKIGGWIVVRLVSALTHLSGRDPCLQIRRDFINVRIHVDRKLKSSTFIICVSDVPAYVGPECYSIFSFVWRNESTYWLSIRSFRLLFC